jgi:hypothetical protein
MYSSIKMQISQQVLSLMPLPLSASLAIFAAFLLTTLTFRRPHLYSPELYNLEVEIMIAQAITMV